MGDLLQTGTAWLADQLDQHVATSGTYRSPAGTVTLPLTLGASEATRSGADGLVLERKITDVMFRYDALAGGGPMHTDSSASLTWRESRSASECTATVAIPASRQAAMMRTAISPRLAIRTLEIIYSGRIENSVSPYSTG